MPLRCLAGFCSLFTVLWLSALAAQQTQPPAQTTLRFEVRLAPGLLSEPADGRLLVVVGRNLKTEPRLRVNHYNDDLAAVLGTDANAWTADRPLVLDQSAAIAPLTHLSGLAPGTYAVQAVLLRNPDLWLATAPGNLYSTLQTIALDPAKGGTVRLEIAKEIPAETLPGNTDDVKYIKLHSELLSKFHGRPVYLRAGLILPRDFAKERERRYPLRVHIGGYGSRYTGVKGLMGAKSSFRKLWLADDTPRMLYLHLDGAGPYGDPYQVNSANNGPYGDAITRELIPYVEAKYRGVGGGRARVLDGASTGGWVSLALQIFYPEFFNGAWSRAPDPVDFRAYELIDIYKDENAYVDAQGAERPASRSPSGNVRTTVRSECRLEHVLGRGDRWERSGLDWCAWNATFGPRGDDGQPRPLWDGKTGKIDRSVLEHWKRYDLRLVLQKDWPTLAPKLRGKLRIWVGEADDYFLNGAVHLLDGWLRTAQPPFEGSIIYGAGQGHSWDPQGEAARMKDMAKAIAADAPAGQ
jgi:hypothetical protein